MSNEFSAKDSSSKPYAWMVEGIAASDLAQMNAEEIVIGSVKAGIAATNYDSEVTDGEMFESWKNESGEFEQAVRAVSEYIENAKPMLTVTALNTNHSEIPTGEIDMTLTAFVQKHNLRKNADGMYAAEWGNGEGEDVFEIIDSE